MSAKEQSPVFRAAELESLCKAVADGLTGTQIGYVLQQVGYPDPDPGMTKWSRLFNALIERQNETQSGSSVLQFVAKALDPARFVGQSEQLESVLRRINTVLRFRGLEYRDDGVFHKVAAVRTLSEAEQRASRLADAVRGRSLHADLLEFCRAELLESNYFHAVLEATKSVASKIRSITDLRSDSAELVDEAFCGDSPKVRINSLRTKSERSEQTGFANLLKGLFGTFRNPTAHAPRIEWDMSEEDAVDLFTFASYVLRRIDRRQQ